jgi:WD40 repeat protein
MVSSEPELKPLWQVQLGDYVTAIAWPDAILAAATVAGELVAIGPCGNAKSIRAADGRSIDALAFSADGQVLAAAGQMGLLLWRCMGDRYEPIAPPEDTAGVWIEQLAWHPDLPILAYGLGRSVQLLDCGRTDGQGQVVAMLPIDNASVMALAWQPQGNQLAVGDYRAVRVWAYGDWTGLPIELPVGSVSVALAWSPDGLYLAAGNLDRNLMVWRWGNAAPWQMRGFPGKVRHVVWATQCNDNGVPYLAVCSQDGVVIWSKDLDDSVGWNSEVLELHQGRVNGVAFAPMLGGDSVELLSAGEEGWIGLWRGGEPIGVLEHEGAVVALRWGPLGVATGTAVGVVSLWPGDF